MNLWRDGPRNRVNGVDACQGPWLPTRIPGNPVMARPSPSGMPLKATFVVAP